jgi:ribulose-phosphate 3-epimerase
MANVKLAPSFLTADFGRLAEQVREVEAAGADYLHLDVMDGRFVPPITFGTLIVEAIRRETTLPLDVHLMIVEPERHVEAFAKASAGGGSAPGGGADIINVHVEACTHLHRVLSEIRRLNCRAGVCLNPATPVTAVEEVLGEVDQVMVMGVNPGWGGQALIAGTTDKVRAVRGALDERKAAAEVEIDGGVKNGNALECARAGAGVLVVGSAVFNDEASPAENLAGFRKLLDGPEK